MTTLAFSCPLISDKIFNRKPEAPFRLQRVGDCTLAAQEWTVDAVNTVTRDWICPISSSCYIFRAQVKRPNDHPLDVVLKMDISGWRREALTHEAEIYQGAARDLCGDVIPAFYGCFQAEMKSMIVTCLVLEDCGEPMKKPVDKMNGDFQIELLQTVNRLHKKGLAHGDLYPRNILVAEGHPVLIDLEMSTPHQCGLRMKLIPGAMAPSQQEFGCDELHDLICRMGLWRSNVLSFCEAYVAKNCIESVEELKSYIPTEDPKYRPAFEKKAEFLWEMILEERRLTYGTDKDPWDQKRVDYVVRGKGPETSDVSTSVLAEPLA
ncbi:hypothetical protein FB45DRAFT_186684 [Roridomyces roridus]|uniref:Protein kinase domain-containing protein n=1 Tax=Roridomyces roridus TaxID=1738132 RepID=A0AAD7CEK5_9AGAR|nr:hypothetical protein FB45DRAFT_186684 [Roridomyces roridus]